MTYHYNLNSFFSQIVKDNLFAPAIITETETYSYNELDLHSNFCANFLSTEGLKQGDVVAIISTKSYVDYCVMIACLKKGITYVNIDPENPMERTLKILGQCKPSLLFCADKTFSESVEWDIPIKSISEKDLKKEDYLGKLPNPDGETIAYIMFTSGSTGIPKGAAITHQNLIHFINWVRTCCQISTSDNFANISPMYFDNSVFDFYGALFNGASLTPIKKELLTNPLELIKYIDFKECTIWFSVPSMLIYLLTMKVLNGETLTKIRLFVFGGEGFPKTELKKLFDLYSNRSKFINVYGPTECTCICSNYEITERDFSNLDELAPLGTINPNFSYVILSDSRESNEGELCLLGPNIGKGYYKDDERSQKVFKAFTNQQHYHKNMYSTGDWVQEKDGLLYFKGRIDNQIKHMGYRIELEEIEANLNSLKEVRESVVLYNKGESKILALVILENQGTVIQIKKDIKAKLPYYMIPHQYIILEAFPKNQNGKVDRKALKTQYVESNQ